MILTRSLNLTFKHFASNIAQNVNYYFQKIDKILQNRQNQNLIVYKNKNPIRLKSTSHGAQKCTVPPKFNSLLRLSFICIRHVNYASESNEPSAVLSEYDGRPSGLSVTDFHQPSVLCILTSSLLFPKRKILPLYFITNFSLCQYRRAKNII